MSGVHRPYARRGFLHLPVSQSPRSAVTVDGVTRSIPEWERVTGYSRGRFRQLANQKYGGDRAAAIRELLARGRIAMDESREKGQQIPVPVRVLQRLQSIEQLARDVLVNGQENESARVLRALLEVAS